MSSAVVIRSFCTDDSKQSALIGDIAGIDRLLVDSGLFDMCHGLGNGHCLPDIDYSVVIILPALSSG